MSPILSVSLGASLFVRKHVCMAWAFWLHLFSFVWLVEYFISVLQLIWCYMKEIVSASNMEI